MSCMTISQVLDLMVSLDCGWADYGSREATCGQELRGSGWRWAVDDRGCVVLESENGSILFKDDLLQYRKARQMSDQGRYDSVVGLAKTASAMFGDPNAHESVRCKVEVDSDASGADVKRAIEDAVKASEKPPEWDGVGLAPVGSIVEVVDVGFGVAYGEELIGKAVTVRAWVHQEHCDVAVLDYEGGLYCFRSEMLRPTSNIATEREREIEVMLDLAGYDYDDTTLGLAGAIYDAGYRKTEGA